MDNSLACGGGWLKDRHGGFKDLYYCLIKTGVGEWGSWGGGGGGAGPRIIGPNNPAPYLGDAGSSPYPKPSN
jgi:hypothetical protein